MMHQERLLLLAALLLSMRHAASAADLNSMLKSPILAHDQACKPLHFHRA